MAATVYAAFQEFASKNELTDAQVSDAKTKHTGVRTCIGNALTVDTAFLTGSYARSTMIRAPKDIDLFVVLDYSKHGATYYEPYDGAQKALDKFHSVLKGCYPTTSIRKDGPAVNLDFSTVGFDVVPAFRRNGGGFVIPNRPGTGWIGTDPTKHAEITSGMNAATGGHFVPLVKMLKVWNRWRYDKLTGFHLEMALAEAWPRAQSPAFPYGQVPAKYTSYAAAAAALFPALADKLWWGGMNDPAGLGGTIDSYLSQDDRTRTIEKLKASGESAAMARQHEANEKHEWAINRWREIFGDFFPAYS